MLRGLKYLFSITLLIAAPAAAKDYKLTLSGASPGGLWSLIGAGVDSAVSAAYPGSVITYQTSPGGFANAALVSRGRATMGLVTDFELKRAMQGDPPFKSKIGNLRVLARVYSPSSRFQVTHLLVNKSFADKHGLTSLRDIRTKRPPVRMALNRTGNADSILGEMILNEHGIKLSDIKAWGGQVVNAASGEQTSLILDRRLDMMNIQLAVRHSRIREVANGIEPVILKMDPNLAAKVASATGGKVCTLTPKDYKFVKSSTATVCHGAVIVVNADMSDKVAYDLAKALVENVGKLKRAHRALQKTLTTAILAEPSVAPIHSGAAKYYRERGLLK